MADEGAALAACEALFPGMDEDTLEYIASTVLDDGELLNRADLVEFVAPLLVDAEFCEEDDEAEALAGKLWEQLASGGGAGGEAAVGVAAAEDAPVLLKERVIVAATKREQEARIAGDLAMTLDMVQDGGCVNTMIRVFAFADEGDLTDKQLREMLKKRKRDDKQFAKDTRLEKASAERRNALIEALRTRPVVLHRDVSCTTIPDINLEGVGMDLDGKVLLEDCTCSIVAGRRYGLIGKNGTGKTTFLRHLAAKAFKQARLYT